MWLCVLQDLEEGPSLHSPEPSPGSSNMDHDLLPEPEDKTGPGLSGFNCGDQNMDGEDHRSSGPGPSSLLSLDSVTGHVKQNSVQDVEEDGGDRSTDPNPTDSSCDPSVRTPVKMCSVKLVDCRNTGHGLEEQNGDISAEGEPDDESDGGDDSFCPPGRWRSVFRPVLRRRSGISVLAN